MVKRKKEDTDVVGKALKVKGSSDTAAFELLHLGRLAKSLPKSLNSFRRAIANELPKHFLKRLPLQDKLYLPMVDLRALLQQVCENNAQFGRRLQQLAPASMVRPLKFVIYIDEAQAGNILAPSMAKKLLLAYGAIAEVGGLQYESMWLDLMAFSHSAIDLVQGGWSRLMKEFVIELHQQLAKPFALQCPSQDAFLISFQISAITGDFDALRCCYDWRGAASIKLCLCCKNLVSKASNLRSYNPTFVDQTTVGLDFCDAWTDNEINDLWDKVKTEPHPCSKAERERNEKAAGFNIYNLDALLANAESRRILPLSKIFFDCMHLYYSNGICSWEIVHFSNAMAEHGLTLDILSDAVVASAWTSDTTKKSKAWYRSLLASKRFSSDSYKGSASDLKSLLPIFAFHVEEILAPRNVMRAELDSLKSLQKICVCLYGLQRAPQLNLNDLNRLQALQKEHHAQFAAAYGADAIKPKHHWRFHVPVMLERHGFYCDCFAMEAKHRTYKYCIQNKFDRDLKDTSVYCERILQRLWIYSIDLMGKRSWPNDLEGPLKPSCLVQGATQGKALQLNRTRVQVGDFLIASTSGLVEECIRDPTGTLCLAMRTYVKAPRPRGGRDGCFLLQVSLL